MCSRYVAHVNRRPASTASRIALRIGLSKCEHPNRCAAHFKLFRTGRLAPAQLTCGDIQSGRAGHRYDVSDFRGEPFTSQMWTASTSSRCSQCGSAHSSCQLSRRRVTKCHVHACSATVGGVKALARLNCERCSNFPSAFADTYKCITN